MQELWKNQIPFIFLNNQHNQTAKFLAECLKTSLDLPVTDELIVNPFGQFKSILSEYTTKHVLVCCQEEALDFANEYRILNTS